MTDLLPWMAQKQSDIYISLSVWSMSVDVVCSLWMLIFYIFCSKYINRDKKISIMAIPSLFTVRFQQFSHHCHQN